MHTNAEPEGIPCWHMKPLVSAYLDGDLKGFLRWYVQQHIAGCPRCQAAIAALSALKDRLRGLNRGAASEERPLSPDRWEQIETAWREGEAPR